MCTVNMTVNTQLLTITIELKLCGVVWCLVFGVVWLPTAPIIFSLDVELMDLES